MWSWRIWCIWQQKWRDSLSIRIVHDQASRWVIHQLGNLIGRLTGGLPNLNRM